MTEKLYEQDAYCRLFEATVLSCEPHKNGFLVVLDKTAFFPEGGGQPADEGTLDGIAVRDVQIHDGVIVHTVDNALAVNQTVRGEIDWEIRFSRMQHHTGEHLLSGILHRLYGADNVGFHLNDTLVTLDVNIPLSQEQIEQAEKAVNRAIQENRDVTAEYPSEELLPTLSYRSKLELTQGVRLVTIDGYDVCACCAPHVLRTGEIGVLKILSSMAYKGGTRLTMVCGMHAYEDYSALHNTGAMIMNLLSAPRDRIAAFVTREHESTEALRATVKKLEETLALSRLEIVRCGNYTCGFTQNATAEALRACAEKVGETNTPYAVFSFNEDGVVNYILAHENGDVREMVKVLNATFNGKGGGKPTMAQGRLCAEREAIQAFLSEY